MRELNSNAPFYLTKIPVGAIVTHSYNLTNHKRVTID